MKNIRESIERFEQDNLSRFATLSSKSKGRRTEIPLCKIRTAFQRDRDRITHSKAFRRLAHKTQVFLAPEGDHYRTRLTHTLEVSQVSRAIARALQLNEDLAEAIALGHDLGHTPFGHEGEMALNNSLKKLRDMKPKRFRHNEQSLRVVEVLEYDGKGLNLTREVRDGILYHTGIKNPATLEGQIVKIADRIAYVNHDIDDAVRAGILKLSDLPTKAMKLLGKYPSQRINTLVVDLVNTSIGKGYIKLSSEIGESLTSLRSALFKKVYKHSEAKVEDEKVKRVVELMFSYYMEHPEEIPDYNVKATKVVKVCDYIAGMTDRYAISVFNELFIPNVWSIKK